MLDLDEHVAGLDLLVGQRLGQRVHGRQYPGVRYVLVASA
jgi:hypothetical protein